jgi:hypothetical protein
MHVHLDGDLLVYRCGFAAEKQQWDAIDVEGGLHASFTTKREAAKYVEDYNEAPDTIQSGDFLEVCKGDRVAEPVENALHNVRKMVEQIMEDLMVTKDEMTLYLSGPTNFRTTVATIKEYKGNRDPDHKPKHSKAIKEYMERHYPVVYSEDEEADDLIGYSHYAMWCNDPRSSIIATVDKDLDMIPGLHYNFIKEDSYYVDEDAANRWFYLQLLMGDSTDNIPGVPGYGPKKAAKELEGLFTETEWFIRALFLYAEHYDDGLEALIENARLLWIRRHPNEWWLPPEEYDTDE